MGNNYVNKFLWFLFGLGLGLVIGYFKDNILFIRKEKYRPPKPTSLIIGAGLMFMVSISWIFFDFWK